jgi:hypothetical protein
VIAVEWASVGNRFDLQVVAGNLAAVETGYPDRSPAVSSLVLDRGRPDPVLIDLELVGPP